jgi:hypothetical protein
VCLVTVLAWSGPDQSGHVEVRARSQRDAHAGRPRRARPSGSTPTRHPHRRGRPGSHRRSGRPVDRAGHPGRLPAAAAARRPIRRLAGVGDREPRRRWRRPDPVPAGSGRAGGGGAGPAKRAARRHGAKSDPWSDQGGPRGLGRDRLAQPRAAGHRAALSVRLAARGSAVQAATDANASSTRSWSLLPVLSADGWVTSPHLGWSSPAGGSASRPPGMSRPPPPRPRPCGAWPAASTS